MTNIGPDPVSASGFGSGISVMCGEYRADVRSRFSKLFFLPIFFFYEFINLTMGKHAAKRWPT